MSELLFAYRLLRAPRYEESVLEESLKESLAAQRAMWDSMRFYGGGGKRCALLFITCGLYLSFRTRKSFDPEWRGI